MLTIRQIGSALYSPVVDSGIWRLERKIYRWRRRADSNRCIEVLQTSPLATWVRRPGKAKALLQHLIVLDAARQRNWLVITEGLLHITDDPMIL
jgi:hypothetical protein